MYQREVSLSQCQWTLTWPNVMCSFPFVTLQNGRQCGQIQGIYNLTKEHLPPREATAPDTTVTKSSSIENVSAADAGKNRGLKTD